MTSWKILVGDCLKVMQDLDGESVDMIWTSPPYFGLRNYQHDDQIGQEPSPEEFVEAIVKVMREARRVLKNEGTLWLNIGDSYSRGSRKTVPEHRGSVAGNRDSDKYLFESASANLGGHASIKPKDLMGIPWRVALALQEDGWYLRQEIIWAKAISGQEDFENHFIQAMRKAGLEDSKIAQVLKHVDLPVGSCMPESVKDRFVSAFEPVFLLTKSSSYYFDVDSVRENSITPADGRNSWEERKEAGHPSSYKNSPSGSPSDGVTVPSLSPPDLGRNRRNVWRINPSSYRGAHFATAPEDLIRPCIEAGCPPEGLVLDPFAGAGTTLLVADKLGRKSIGIELNPDYAKVMQERLEEHSREHYDQWDERYIPPQQTYELPEELTLNDLFNLPKD